MSKQRVRLTRALLVSAMSVALISVGTPAQAAVAPGCSGRAETFIITSVTDVPYISDPLRCGSSSTYNYGWNKIYGKHGITVQSRIQLVVTTDYAPQNDGRYIYRLALIRNDGGPAARIVMRVVVDRTQVMADGKKLGVVTAYCEGTTVCPTWVNNSIKTAQA